MRKAVPQSREGKAEGVSKPFPSYRNPPWPRPLPDISRLADFEPTRYNIFASALRKDPPKRVRWIPAMMDRSDKTPATLEDLWPD